MRRKEGELSLPPIFSQVLLRSAAHLFKWGREGRDIPLPCLFHPQKCTSRTLLSPPDNHSGEGPWMEEKGGISCSLSLQCWRRSHLYSGKTWSFPSSLPLPRCPPPPVFSEFGCRGRESESRERLPLPQAGTPPLPSLSFLHFLCWSSSLFERTFERGGAEGKIEGPSPLTSNSWGTTTLLTQRQVPYVEDFLTKKALRFEIVYCRTRFKTTGWNDTI